MVLFAFHDVAAATDHTVNFRTNAQGSGEHAAEIPNDLAHFGNS